MADPAGLVHLEEETVSGTHALVIGIGKYPHLVGGQEQATLTDGMRQLSSPPVSARAFADWLIQDYHFPGKQLASLSLLLSEVMPEPYVNPKTGRSYEVPIAEIDSIEKAVKAWKARGDSNTDNRLIFYFCGHGISESDEMALLAADFNGDDDNPLNQALDLRQLMLGLAKCRAREQVFFIDACRSSSDTLLSRSGMYAGRVPFLPGRPPPDWPRRLWLPYYATLAGDMSHAVPGKVSLFTDALLRGLRGVGSDNPDDDDVWRVNTSGLQEAIHHFMTQPTFAGKLAGIQVPTVTELPVFDLNQLKKPPVVPVYVGCAISTYNGIADFFCRRRGKLCDQRPAASVDPDDPFAEWTVNLVFDRYDFEAKVADGVWLKSREIRPKYKRITLEPRS
jgi:Caspase domain